MSKVLINIFFIALIFLCVESFSDNEKRPDKCILVFGAHADDIEIMAGGTFAKYIDQGYEGIYVVVINNTCGCLIERIPGGGYADTSRLTVSNSPHTYPVEGLETIQIRTEEAIQAAKIFGAEPPVFLNFRETWVWTGRTRSYIGTEEFHRYNPPGRQIVSVATRLSENINAVVDLLKKYEPEITIIHTLGGEKHDHGNSAYLMYLAFKKALAEGVPLGKLWMVVKGWFTDSYAIMNGRGKPDVRIDVTDYLKIKHEALMAHVSQQGWGELHVESGKRYYEEFITVFDD